MSYRSALLKDYSNYNMARHMPVTTYSEVMRNVEEHMNINDMLVQSCGAIGVGLMKSTIEHVMEVFDFLQG